MMQLIAQLKENSVTTVKCTTTSKPFAVGAKTMGILEAMVEANLEAVAEAEATLAVKAVVVVEVEAVVEAEVEAGAKGM